MTTVPVSQVMTKDPIVISPEVGVDSALELMSAQNIRRLPVVSETGRLVGIITREEARLAVERARCEDPFAPRIPKVRERMTDYVYTVTPTDTIAEAVKVLVGQKIGAVPVMEDRRLVGILTESDIFKFLAGELKEPA